MRLTLIRHSITQGNLDKRYIGSTDETLSPSGVALARRMHGIYDRRETLVYTSPLKRCVETAQILFPSVPAQIVSDFRECDFGSFENKNYEELKDNQVYQAWLKTSGNNMSFPEGEGAGDFSCRVRAAFSDLAGELIASGAPSAALVLHGGTVMAILSGFDVSGRDFWHWRAPNCGGYEAELDVKQWSQDGHLMVIRKITPRF